MHLEQCPHVKPSHQVKLRHGFPVAKADKSWLKFWRTTTVVSWHPWSHQITLPSGCCGSNSGNFCKASSETCSWGWDKGMTDPLSPPAVQPPAQPATQVCQASAQVWPLPKWFWTLLRLKMSPLGMVLCWSHLHSFALYGDACKPKHSLQFSIHGCSALQWVLWPQLRCLIRNMCISKPPKIKVSFPLSFQTPVPCCKCSQHWLP